MPSKSAQNKTKKSLSKIDKIFLVLAVVIVGFFIAIVIIGVINSVNAENKRKVAEAAEQARIAADPLTTNGVYTALNKERTTTGAQALSTIPNLTTASEQMCNDMVAYKYFDYKNPTTGKEANSFVKDNGGDLYLPSFVMTIFSGNFQTQTSSDIVAAAISSQATNLNNPSFDSVGWAVCQSPNDPSVKYVVGALANKEEKPAAPTTIYRSVPTYVPPTSIRCHTTYNNYGGYLSPTATTNCY